MNQELEPLSEAGVLTPSIPWDIGARTQRDRILKAMAKSCAKKSFAATTIADIVSHASISRATFYKHFSNKRECFNATVDSFLAELRGSAENALPDGDESVESAIREVIATLLGRLAAKPDHAKLLLVEAPIVDPKLVQHYRRITLAALEARLRAAEVEARAGADPEIAFGRAKVLVADYVAAGKAKELPSLLPELVYIAQLPYLGQELALEQAQLVR
ncbi:MAG TPA: TetR/AcrR family transcriptional regulator [Solirubrobacterales bacterium]|jgi:AcrR family transcriptional regulator|nr:TetR/AcrR family transcriptional regulator [Solirubrobacterales bacterium]